MIKIKSGVYGYRDENGTIQPKTSKSEAFSLSAKEEERLVKRGVAVYSTDTPVATLQEDDDDEETGDNPPGSKDGGNGNDGGENDRDNEKPEYSIETNGNVLRKFMKNAGLQIGADMTKAEMVAALDAYYDDEGANDDEPPPLLGASEPVT